MSAPPTPAACSHVLCRLVPGGRCTQAEPPPAPPMRGRPKGAKDKGPRKSRRRNVLEAFIAGRNVSNMPMPPMPPPLMPVKAAADFNPQADHQALEDEATRRRQEKLSAAARASLAEFVKQGWHVLHPSSPLYWGKHMQAVCDHVQALIMEVIRAKSEPAYRMAVQNLLINIPPRSAKSMLVSVYAPAWAWLVDPTLKIRCTSGNPRVAMRDSRYCRMVIESSWYQETFSPDWTVRVDIDAVGLFANSAMGERHASSFQSKVTGEGTDIIIIDDPHDAEEVTSDVLRQAVLDKWDSALANRVNDPMRSARIGIMQRLHEGDWAGHVLSQGGWEHLVVRQEFEPPVEEGAERPCECATCLRGETWLGWKDWRTEDGELLQPERFPREWVAAERVRLGEYGYAGQHQQRPSPADGGIFKKHWLKPVGVELLPSKFDQLVLSIDAASKKTTKGSATSILLFGRKGQQKHLLHRRTGMHDIDGLMRIVRGIHANGVELGGVRITGRISATLVEDKAMGSAVCDVLQKELPGVIRINPGDQRWSGGSDKVSRALAIQPDVESGNLIVYKEMVGLDAYLHELTTFPHGSRDDDVDATTQMLNWARGSVHLTRFLAAYAPRTAAAVSGKL